MTFLRSKFGLSTLADPKPMWEEFDQDNFENNVRAGYINWKGNKSKRPLGQNPNGPESEAEKSLPEQAKAVARDNRSYFSNSLMASAPSKELKVNDNWYGQLTGEWDVAWTEGQGTADQKIIPGEWNISWINDGEAMQDLLNVPYRWQTKNYNREPIRRTSLRVFNKSRSAWEGFHAQAGQLLFFQTSKNPKGQLVESFRLDESTFEAWVFDEILSDSFKVTISQSTNQGQSYHQIGEIWAKRRGLDIPE
jgi:hypothetical protein